MSARPTARPGPAAAAVLLGVLVAVPLVRAPLPTVAGAVLVSVAVAVLIRPANAAYLLIATTPLVVGLARGSIVPLLRLNEALGLFLAAVLIARGLVRFVGGARFRPSVTSVDVTVVLLAVTSSILPLLWMLVRRDEITQDDLFYALTLWKFYGIYLLVRCTIRTDEEVRRCLFLALAAGAVVAIIGLLQVSGALGVPDLLNRYYAGEAGETDVYLSRGTSTLASSLNTGDVMAYDLAIVLSLQARRRDRRGAFVGLGVLFVFGGLAAGEFSAAIALVVAVLAAGFVTGRLTRRVLSLVPTGGIAAVALWPVVQRRLSGFQTGAGAPPSWEARLHNLRTFFWPPLFSGLRFLVGVRPAARLPLHDPDTKAKWVYIESGHTWLLWNGGLLMLAAFVAFVVTGLRTMATVARHELGSTGAAAAASFAAIATMTVLMAFDPHLVGRGSGDLLFSLLALGMTTTARGHDTDASPTATEAIRPLEAAGGRHAPPTAPRRP